MFIDIGSIYAVIRSILVIYTSDNRDEITFSSFQDTNSQKKKFDDKYWTLIVENVSLYFEILSVNVIDTVLLF